MTRYFPSLAHIALICLFPLISGCGTIATAVTQASHGETGREISPESLAQIKKGETTKKEVLQLLGEPSSKNESDQASMFYYAHNELEFTPESYIPILGSYFRGIEGESTAIYIHFDQNGTVSSVEKSTTDSKSDTGIIQTSDQRHKSNTQVEQIKPKGSLIYLYVQEKQYGPYTFEQIQSMLDKKRITLETWAWRKGLDKWVQLNEIVY